MLEQPTNWTAVILAGGLGSRLFPLTQEIPKPLVPVGNKAMLDYAIDHVKYAGIKKIVIVLKHLGEKIRAHMEEKWYGNPEKIGDLDIKIPRVDSKDTADALRKVSNLIETDYVLVSMGDIVTNLPLKNFLKYHEEKNAFSTISMKTIDEPTQYGVVMLDSDKKIHLFLEKPDSRELYVSSIIQRSDIYLHTNLINTGIYAFKSEIVDLLNSEHSLMDFGRNVFPYLLENKYDIYGFVENYYWMDVGQPKPYLWANWDIIRGYGWPVTPNGKKNSDLWYEEKPTLDQGTVIQKPGAFGKNLSIGRDVKIKELCVIDENTAIGENTIIEKSVIWENVKIGANCDIKESIICNNVKIGENVRINESVIGPNCIIQEGKKVSYQKIVHGENDDSE